ncbi:uncharacterized protein C2orf78-like [Sciurus carolinensis]|uniref:uncharacterized protein C2orf78-like n=1 Tax=Sciurus carolinensis TaxID=30640 RepID=UPI001FB398F8|nr:uncharacterized protein C2orf78-like [Sciurus carolinensis]
MHSLASVTQTSSGVVSSSFVSAIDVTSSLTMSENFQNSSIFGTTNSLPLSLPVVSNAASLTGSTCNFSRVSASAVSSAWLLPSNSGTSFQPLMSSAYLYQHSSTAMLSGVTSQQQIPMAPASYPSIFEWDNMGGTEKKSSALGDYTLTVTEQDTAAPSMSMTAQYDTPSDANVIFPEYPSLSARLVQVAPSQIPNQAHTLSLPYQAESQVYYYDQNTLGPLLSGDLGPYLQSYDSVSYARNRVAAPQPEMVMVLKEVPSTNILPLVSTPGTHYCVSTQAITERNFQVMETTQGMEASVELQPPSQTFCLPQPPEFPNSCSSRSMQNLQILESNPPTEPGDISVITPDQSSTNFVALPPTQSQEETDSLDEVKAMLSNPLDAYLFAVENQDPPLLPLEISDSHELLASIGPLDQEEMSHSEHINLGKSSLSLEDQGTLENGIECSSDFADLTALVGDIHLPEIFNFFKDLDQPGSPQIIKANDTRDIMVNQEQVNSSDIKDHADQVRKNKHKASESPDGTPKAKLPSKPPECTLEGKVACRDADSQRALGNRAQHSNRKTQKAATSSNSKAKGHGQEKPKRSTENRFKKAEDSKQAGNKVKTEEKPMVPKAKRKRNQPELSQETFKKPRSYLGMHMLESVQVFHALGKKNDKNPGLSSSRALGNSSSNKDPRPCPARKPWLQVKGPEKTQVRAQKPDISADKECPSPSQHELPPPGKVKLVPLPFLSPEKPQPRPVYRRPQSLASRRPTVAYPAQPASTSSAQPRAVNQSRPAPANTSFMRPAKPAQPAVSHSIHSGFTTSTQPSVPQSAASRPAAYTTSSCTSVQRGPVSTLVNKLQSQLPKPQNRYLLQDFALQPIPWRKPNVPEPVMSTPITEEQRPEREAMKKKAQQERENAAKYPLGRVQFFIEREREMEIANYYGYTI